MTDAHPGVPTAKGEPIAVLVEDAIGAEFADSLAQGGAEVRRFSRYGGSESSSIVPMLSDQPGLLDGISLIVDAAVRRRPMAKGQAIQDIHLIRPDAVIATLALTASTTYIAQYTHAPELVCGFGYLPPLADTSVIEVAPGLRTDEPARLATVRLCAMLGKEPVVVSDGAGLVGPRIVALIINEAAFALTEGVASAQDIDAGVRLGANYPHGPLEWADLIGIDLVYDIINAIQWEQGEDRYRPAPLLRKMMLAGWTGKAAGRGFYSYS